MIVGAHDQLTPPVVAETLAADLGAPLTVIADAGHLSNIDQPAAFNQALHTHLKRVG